MSINANIQITGNESFVVWNNTLKSWDGVIVKITYPLAPPGTVQQNYSNNPPSVGDFIIDESGKVWKILSVDNTWTPKTSNYYFRISIQVQNRDKIEIVEPEFGTTMKGVISTPVNNALSPISESNTTSSFIQSTSLSYNIEKSLISGSSGGTGGTTPAVQTVVNTSADTYTSSGNELILCAKEGNQVITLNAPSESSSTVNIKKLSGTGVVTIHPVGATIDGISSDLNIKVQFENITLSFYQNNWNII